MSALRVKVIIAGRGTALNSDALVIFKLIFKVVDFLVDERQL